MTVSEEIMHAMRAHGLWKDRLREAVVEGKSAFSVATVGVDNACDFGKYLYSVTDPAVKKSSHWRECHDLHSRFHKEAAHVLQLAVSGRKESADEAMSVQSEFAKVSRALTAAMLQWRSSAS